MKIVLVEPGKVPRPAEIGDALKDIPHLTTRLEAAEDHCLLSATALNLKRMIWATT